MFAKILNTFLRLPWNTYFYDNCLYKTTEQRMYDIIPREHMKKTRKLAISIWFFCMLYLTGVWQETT